MGYCHRTKRKMTPIFWLPFDIVIEHTFIDQPKNRRQFL